MSKIRLINAELSKINLYPDETLYIKCTFQALEDMPVDEEVQLFADFHFGHMTIDAKEAKYYRVTANMYPQPMHYKKGEKWASTVMWRVPKNQWGGSLGVYVGMMNRETQPIKFNAENDEYYNFYIDDINISFVDVAKKFMQEHSGGKVYSYFAENLKSEEYKHNYDAIIGIRDIKTDNEIKIPSAVTPNEKVLTDYVSFSFKQSENSFFIDDVKEKAGYEFLYLKLPTLFVRPESKMITMYGEGRIVNPENSYPWGYEQVYFIRNAAILENGKNSLLIEAPYLDEKLHQSVCEKDGKRFCAVGVTLSYRIRAYGELESLKVINKPTVQFFDIPGAWQNCLPKLREGIKKKTDMYDRCVFYYNDICKGPGEKAKTFNDALEEVKTIYELTGGVRQYMLLCGWQHDGHDTGYPDVFTINKRVGTYEEMQRCVEEAKKYNACITFHDNYDDIYEENGYFDSDIAAIGANGKYYSSWIWTSGISVMTSFPKYFKTNKMQERVKKTVELLPLDKSYHIDVLSQEVRRYDFDKNIKSAAQETLEYKYAVIKEFEKYGITVTSEGITHPFAGKIGYAWRLNANNNMLFTDEEAIPLTAMIYHGLVPYSERGNTGVIFGGNIAPENIDDKKAFQRIFFTRTLPIGMLCNEFMEDYSFKDGVHNITYSNNSAVVFDEINDTVEVKYKGEYLTKDGITMAKGYKENEYLCYSETGTFRVKNIFGDTIGNIADFAGKELAYKADEYLEVDCEKAVPFRITLNNIKK